MSTNLSAQKTILAKLLAGENLSVVHDSKLTSAAINLKTRTLYLPVWEDMSSEIYDLLAGHEVGHALFTPEQGWHSAVHDENGNFIGALKDVYNVCEDARIEKLIKRRYPGLSKSFVSGYRTLHERDFFGIKKLHDISKLNIVDRINLYFKIGAFFLVPFTEEERILVREVESAETWNDIVSVVEKLYEILKNKSEGKLNSFDDLQRELESQFEEFGYDLDLSDDNDDEKDEKLDSDLKPSDDPSDESSPPEEEKTEENVKNDEMSQSSGDSAEERSEETEKKGEPQSITDRIFRQREREFLTNNVEVFTYDFPTPNLENIIVPHEVFAENFMNLLNQTLKAYRVAYRVDYPIVQTCLNKFNERNVQYINLLVKEFEMRKNASQYERSLTAKSGELDMNKLHDYRLSNDLFRRIKIVPKGKSHGMMMFVDMSGSMTNCFGSIMEQTLALVAFCRKVNIPFEVYGFSDSIIFTQQIRRNLPYHFNTSKFNRKSEDAYSIDDAGFHLVHFISSRLRGNSYRRAFSIMATIAMNWQNELYPRFRLPWDRMGLSLNGTPFIQTLMASRPMIEQFRSSANIDIANVVYLTDGDGTGCFRFGGYNRWIATNKTYKVFFVDQKTKKRIELTILGAPTITSREYCSIQTRITEFVRELTGCKHIGFYISSKRNTKRKLTTFNDEKLVKCFKKNDYFAIQNIGYDMYYYMAEPTLKDDDFDFNISDDMTSKKVAREFTNSQLNKSKKRVIVKRFMQDLTV